MTFRARLKWKPCCRRFILDVVEDNKYMMLMLYRQGKQWKHTSASWHYHLVLQFACARSLLPPVTERELMAYW